MIWYVAIGSAIGGVARYLIGSWMQRFSGFPWGTLAVNITGSFILGWFARYAVAHSVRPEIRAFIAVGICGGYTTFSAFSYESMSLLRDGHWLRAGTYITGSVVLSLLAVFAGMAAGPAAAGNA
jgi:CrcB protein